MKFISKNDCTILIVVVHLFVMTKANPASKPYIPFRTSPFDQDAFMHHKLEWEEEDDTTTTTTTKSKIKSFDISKPNTHMHQLNCPLPLFSLGISSKLHYDSINNGRQGGLGIVESPIIFPILPSEGPGRQILYTTQYEQLDMLTPVKGQQQKQQQQQLNTNMASSSSSSSSSDTLQKIKEGLTQHFEFPLLFESSSFLSSPIIADVNQDGVLDAILADYDGGIYAIGLQVKDGGERWFHRTQVPRLYVRRKWMESMVNETLGIETVDSEDSKDEEQDNEEDTMKRDKVEKTHDPYHSYFEYYYGTPSSHETILRGVPAHVMGQDQDQVQTLEQRRKRKVIHDLNDENGIEVSETSPVDQNHRRLQESKAEEDELGIDFKVKDDDDDNVVGDAQFREESNTVIGDDLMEDYASNFRGDDAIAVDDVTDDWSMADRYYNGDDEPRTYRGDDDYARYDDYYGRYDYSEHDDYYNDKHYVRLPPHILCTPTLMEFPKMYSDNGETEHLLFVAVSYYFDEDEYEGHFSYKRFDETDDGLESEIKRGMYVSSAILVYQFTNGAHRWGRQEHLDLSGDPSAPPNATLVGSIPISKDINFHLGAFALGSPTVADIDGDGEMEVLMGTSMGIVYCLDGRNLYNKGSWPVQFTHAIESRILVEDVRGDTNLEVFVADEGGNIVCLDHQANKIWHRDLLASINLKNQADIISMSQMVLGDINGDGVMDIVVVAKVQESQSVVYNFVFAFSADTGKDIENFPMKIENGHDENDSPKIEFEKVPAPLLVDFHADQSFLVDYLRRDGAKWSKPSFKGSSKTVGGRAAGLHLVLPVDSTLVIIEAGSGCTQSISIGETIQTMVQADNVHGRNSLDLVISTVSGDIITLETESPYHPLNVWNNGEIRGRWNAFAHGYSASQGIFVHDVSRQYRDIFGVYVPVTFEIFDNRPNIKNEPEKRVYKVEIREGTVTPRLQKTYTNTGVFTERIYIPSGPGYYSMSVVLKSTHGIIYEDTFHIGYNVNYMSGFGILLWLPLIIGSISIFVFGSTKITNWEDDDYEGNDKNGGILGSLPE